MSGIIILYSSTDGHTHKICDKLRSHIEQTGTQVSLQKLETPLPDDIERYDTIVIGASIRYGKHRPSVSKFIRQNETLLRQKHSAFFSVNLVARKPEKNSPETNPYLRKFLQRIDWKPDITSVFAGMLDYPRYSWIDRHMIRLIMRMSKGPTDPKARIEFTDWNQVSSFARQLLQA